MCGICGIVSKDSFETSSIYNMNTAMSHRGPDDEGIYIRGQNSKIKSQPLFVGLAHRRLSIIDLSEAGHQPISNEDGSIWLVFNGEIYNYLALKDELINDGHIFRSNTDSEVIVHLYEKYGVECLSNLNGMFAFAIWDDKKEELFIARDRAGKKPIVYYLKDGIFIFASEFKSLFSSGMIKPEVNLEGIDDYLSLGYIPAPKTGYKSIYKLSPAHYIIYKNNTIEINRYWSINYDKKINISFKDASYKVLELLKDAVKIRLISDVPLGAFLSGGIDSSAVVALMSQVSTNKIKTFSIGFNEAQYNELGYAREVAKRFDTDHYEFVVKPDALEVLPLLIERYGEPYADSSAIPTYYVAKLTKEHVTVALNGDGGDELFAGYERYNAMRLAEYYHMLPKAFRDLVFKPIYMQLPDSIDPKNRLRRIRRFFEGAEQPVAERYLRWIGIFNNFLKDKIYTTDMKNGLKGESTVRWFNAYFESCNGLNLVDKLLRIDTNLYLPFDLLTKVDIVSMANSLEARSPFLDYRLIEYAASLPPEYKLNGFTSKYILKEMLKDILPAQNIYRRKMGFGVPIRLWFRNELKDYLRDILLSDISLKRGYFNSNIIENMVNNHISGKEDNSFQLWALLMLELWHRRFIDIQDQSCLALGGI